MKKISLIAISFFMIVFFVPFLAYAHGGVEKRAGNILVTLFQSPLSPFVGETVDFSFILTDTLANTHFVGKHARLIVTETTVGDPRKDKIVLTKNVQSDVNGVISFSDTFYKTNYYDIDLEFGKRGDEEHTAGFLVQPRSTFTFQSALLAFSLMISLLVNGIVLFILFRKK